MSNKEIAMMLINNEGICFGCIDPTVVYITNGTIDYDSGRCERYNSAIGQWEDADVVYAKDRNRKFHFGMILTRELSDIQRITQEDLEEMLNSGDLNRDEVIELLDKTNKIIDVISDCFVLK